MTVTSNVIDPVRIRLAIRRLLGRTRLYTTATYVGESRSLSASTVTTTAQQEAKIKEMNDVLATLIRDLQDKGMLSE